MFYTLSNIALRLLLPLLMRLDVRGLERVPPTGSLMVVANHINWIDPPLLGALLRRRITFMAKREVFETPVLGQIATWYGAFGVRRGEPDHRAIRRALALLEMGDALGMFPEGTRSKTGRLQPGHPGAAPRGPGKSGSSSRPLPPRRMRPRFAPGCLTGRRPSPCRSRPS